MKFLNFRKDLQKTEVARLDKNILTKIFSFMPIRDMPNLAQSNKEFYEIIGDPQFWKKELHFYFPREAMRFEKSGNSKLNYQNEFKEQFKRFRGAKIVIYSQPIAKRNRHIYLKLFNLVKEGNLNEILKLREKDPLKSLDKPLLAISMRDADGFRIIFDYISYFRHQHILNKFYEEGISELKRTQKRDDHPHPLILASLCNQPNDIPILITKASVSNEIIFKLLLHAIKYGHNDVIKALIKHGVKIAECPDALRTALINGNLEIVKMLLESNIEAINSDTKYSVHHYMHATPLYLAASAGHLEIVKFLLDKGEPVNVGSIWKRGRTPLEVASMNGHFDVAKKLIEKGALTYDSLVDSLPPLLCTHIFVLILST
jgi:Ankyrin repeats (3 copies)/Ankyrin repeats (many copies)